MLLGKSNLSTTGGWSELCRLWMSHKLRFSGFQVLRLGMQGSVCWTASSDRPSWRGAGTVVIGESNLQTENVMNLAWLTGSFTFAILLGVVSEDITSYVDVRRWLHTACEPCTAQASVMRDCSISTGLSTGILSPAYPHLAC